MSAPKSLPTLLHTEVKEFKSRCRMLRDLDAESKLDRDPAFIEEMMAYGEREAAEFLISEFGSG